MLKKTISHEQFMEAKKYGDWREIGIDNFMHNIDKDKQIARANFTKNLIRIGIIGITSSAVAMLVYENFYNMQKSVYAF